MPKQYTHIEIHASGRVDPHLSRMICEAPGCASEFVVADAYSVVVCALALSGPDLRISSQCPDEQHYACSPECMVACVTACARNHLLPLHAAALAEQQAQQAKETAAAPASSDAAQSGV